MKRTWRNRLGPVAALLPILAVMVGGCGTGGWRRQLAAELPVMGHRNWIVVADAAYPAQSREGIETVYTGANQIETVEAVLAAVARAPHVRPIVYVDAELEHVAERDAPGIEAYREHLKRLVGDRPVRTLPHEDIIARLDEAGKTFRILILKTDMTLPYTTVFLELDCGYWSAEAERSLRRAFEAAK